MGVSRVSAGGNVHIEATQYMIFRGEPHKAWGSRPAGEIDTEIGDKETISDLRLKLERRALDLNVVRQLSVSGTLFPCALLSSGWWEHQASSKSWKLKWRDKGTQQWLFEGFDKWGPSWDFTWDMDNWHKSQARPHFIAQLGDGDEANSLPVFIPRDKAQRLNAIFRQEKWGGVEAQVTGMLGSRKQFTTGLDARALELFGGLLDYCLWLDADNEAHCIEPSLERTQIYSGYLWKCLAPKAWIAKRKPCLNDVYFVWEHTNFAKADAVDYALEALEHKERFLERRHGKLVLLQKSSSLVPGKVALPSEDIYSLLLQKRGIKI
jgi:hypothetical protein